MSQTQNIIEHTKCEVVDRYEIKRKLGKGSFGQTYLVTRETEPEKSYVLKQVKISRRDMKHSLLEIDILKTIAQYGCKDNILCYIDYFITQNPNDTLRPYIINLVTTSFTGPWRTTKGFNYNISTLSDLIKYNIQEEKKIEVGSMLNIMNDMLDAIVYLHKLGIAHGDIKPANVLVREDYSIQIIDFGLSCASSKCYIGGTMQYIPPELLKTFAQSTTGSQKISSSYFTLDEVKRSDVFATGLVFYELANLNLPYKCKPKIEADIKYDLNEVLIIEDEDEDEDEVFVDCENATLLYFSLQNFYENKGKQIKSFYNFNKNTVDKNINKLIERMLDVNPTTRITANDALTRLKEMIDEFYE